MAGREVPALPVSISFRVNGKPVSIKNPDPSLLLVDFFRENLFLTGPKKPCGEGGCGGCTSVMVKPVDWDETPKSICPEFLSFNSCLRRVVQCEGLEFFTTEYFADMELEFDGKLDETLDKRFEEKFGERFNKIKDAKDSIPKAIAFNNGSQCGYCNSGFVSNLGAYCANTCKSDRKIVDIENLFDGNLCRCTGFRPILYGAKTLAHDNNKEEAKNTPALVTSELNYYNGGLEHKNVTVIRPTLRKRHGGGLTQDEPNGEDEITFITGEVSTWFSGFTTANSLFNFVYGAEIPQEAERNFAIMKFVGANSSRGIYKQIDGYNPKYLFDTTGIKSMRCISMPGARNAKDAKDDENFLTIGAGCTITMLYNLLREIQKSEAGTRNVEFIEKATDNIERVASTILRNIVSIGGNISMEVIFGFGSDLVNSLYALGSVLTVWYGSGEDLKSKEFTIPQFFSTFASAGQSEKYPLFLIESIRINIEELLSMKTIGVGCYKVAKRLELSHAIANGGCLLGVQGEKCIARVGFTIPSATAPSSEDYGLNIIIPFQEFTQTMKVLESFTPGAITVDQLKLANDKFNEESKNLYQGDEFANGVSVANQIFEKFLLQIYYQNVDNSGTIVSEEDLVDIFHARRITASAGEQRFNVYREEASEPRVKADALIQAQGKAFYTWNNHNLNSNVLHANFLCSIKGFSPFKVKKKKIENKYTDKDGIKTVFVYTAEDAGTRGLDKGDAVRNDLWVQCNDDKPQLIGGSRWIAKEYTQYAGQPVALLLSEDETKLANALATIQNNHEEYVTYNGNCKLYRSIDPLAKDEKPNCITSEPIVDMDFSIENSLSLQPAVYNLTKVTSSFEESGVDYKDPKIDWKEFEKEGCEIHTGNASTGGQIHMYMEPQSCIAEPLDNGGIKLLCSTQSPIEVQGEIATMLGVPASKVVIRVIRLGGGFGGKTVQSWTTAAAAASASHHYNRQVRVALDRNTDMAITGGRHPYYGEYKLAFDKESETIKALQMNYKCRAGYSQDCTLIVAAVALSNAFNCYNFETYVSDVTAYYTNTVSNTAFRSFGVIQAHQLTESIFETLADRLTVGDHPERYGTEDSFKNYEEALYQKRFHIRQKNFLKNNDKVPYATRPLKHVHTPRIWRDCKKTYDAWCLEAIKFNGKSLTKKMGVGIMPMMYAVSFNIPSLMQGEASLGIKTDGSVILIIGCVEMGQGINTKMMQLVSQKLRIPYSFIETAELTSNSPPNPQGTGASTGTDLNGTALVKAAEDAFKTINKYCYKYWVLLKACPQTPKAKNLFGGKEIQDLFTAFSTDESGCYQYPALWIPNNIAKEHREAKKELDISPSDKYDENKERMKKAEEDYENAKKDREKVWKAMCAQLGQSRATLIYSAHSKVKGVTEIDPTTGRGDPDMYQTYAAAISQVEVDMLTGEINFLKAKVIFDAGQSLNPAVDIGQVEGAFIQGCGYMTSEEVSYELDGDKKGFNTTDTTWEYKPFFTKSIPQKFIVNMYPSEENENEIDGDFEDAMEYRREQRRKAHGTDAKGVMSSKSTGEPPVVIAISMFQAIRDALRAHQDYLYRKFSPNKVPCDAQAVIDFTEAPATVSRIQEAIRNINVNYQGACGNQNFISLLAKQN